MMQVHKKGLVFGSLNLDYVYELDHIVNPGETISSRSLRWRKQAAISGLRVKSEKTALC